MERIDDLILRKREVFPAYNGLARAPPRTTPLQDHRGGTNGVVESAWGAVSMLPSVRFPRPLAEHAVCVSTQLALHGICR